MQTAALSKVIFGIFIIPFFLFLFTLVFGLVYLPLSYGSIICPRPVRPSCFVGATPCIRFKNLCTIPPLWYNR